MVAQVLDVGSGPYPLTGNALHIDLERCSTVDVLADGYKLPFVDGSFRTVYCSHTLEHVVNPYAFLLELRRVASERVVVQVPNASHYRAFPNSVNHIYGWTRFNFQALLELVFPKVEVQQNYRFNGLSKLATVGMYAVSLFHGQNELTAVCYVNK